MSAQTQAALKTFGCVSDFVTQMEVEQIGELWCVERLDLGRSDYREEVGFGRFGLLWERSLKVPILCRTVGILLASWISPWRVEIS